MSILDRLMHRSEESQHEKWLADHPGKEHMPHAEPSASEAEQAATRARMEAELAEQNAKLHQE